jgi:hypothetical protein
MAHQGTGRMDASAYQASCVISKTHTPRGFAKIVHTGDPPAAYTPLYIDSASDNGVCVALGSKIDWCSQLYTGGGGVLLIRLGALIVHLEKR